MLRTEQIDLVIRLGAGGTNLQHGAHGGVAIDVGVVTLHITGAGVDVGDLVDGLHQGGVGLSGTGTVGTVENVGLGGGVEAVVHQLLLDRVLNGLDVGGGGRIFGLQIGLNGVGNTSRVGGIALTAGLQ